MRYAEKLAKNHSGVYYSVFRQDLFDRAVDAERKKTKLSKVSLQSFSKFVTKRMDQKNCSTRAKTLLESWENFAKLKE